jgi:hypothetical protein
MQPFAPRPIRFHGLRRREGWQLKVYSIVHGAEPLDLETFEKGIRLAEERLPAPDVGSGRPGLGFVIAHQGRTGDYVVLGWWDRENELPLRILVRQGSNGAWREARDGESICVWDVEVLWAERHYYVTTMLTPRGSDRAAYLFRFHESG